MENLKINQEKISGILGISQAMVSLILSGKRRISWTMANKLSCTFGKSPAWWMTAKLDSVRRILRSAKPDGSKENGGQNGQQRRAA